MESPTGRDCFFTDNLTYFWLDEETLQTRSLVTGDELISDVQLSPDGQSGAFVRATICLR